MRDFHSFFVVLMLMLMLVLRSMLMLMLMLRMVRMLRQIVPGGGNQMNAGAVLAPFLASFVLVWFLVFPCQAFVVGINEEN